SLSPKKSSMKIAKTAAKYWPYSWYSSDGSASLNWRAFSDSRLAMASTRSRWCFLTAVTVALPTSLDSRRRLHSPDGEDQRMRDRIHNVHRRRRWRSCVARRLGNTILDGDRFRGTWYIIERRDALDASGVVLGEALDVVDLPDSAPADSPETAELLIVLGFFHKLLTRRAWLVLGFRPD